MKKIIFAITLTAFAVSCYAQNAFFNALGTNIQIDTVVNTGTAYLTTRAQIQQERAQQTIIQVNVVKVSGIVAGNITLLGSIDGVNYSIVRNIELQTLVPVVAATDATASYHWRLTGNPFPFYRVSWTGVGTMNATFSARVYYAK